MLKHLLVITLFSLLASAGATAADTASDASRLLPPVPQKAIKKGGYCSGMSLHDLGCTPKIPNATSVDKIYEQGWRVVSHVIDSYGYYRLVIEEQ